MTGRTARRPPALDRILTNRTVSGRGGLPPNGFSVSRRMRSRPSQRAASALNGSFRSNSARNFVRDPGLRTTNVPAAPTLTTQYSLSSLARTLGRNVLYPPMLTPRRKTIRAITVTGSPLCQRFSVRLPLLNGGNLLARFQCAFRPDSSRPRSTNLVFTLHQAAFVCARGYVVKADVAGQRAESRMPSPISTGTRVITSRSMTPAAKKRRMVMPPSM